MIKNFLLMTKGKAAETCLPNQIATRATLYYAIRLPLIDKKRVYLTENRIWRPLGDHDRFSMEASCAICQISSEAGGKST